MKTAYNTKTNEIIASGTHIEHMRSANVAIIDGYCPHGAGYIKDNKIVYYTSKQLANYNNRPKYNCIWDNNTMSWKDARSELEIRNTKYLEIKHIANFTDVSNISVKGKVYQADKKSRDIMAQKLLVCTLLNNQENFLIEWTLVDNTFVELNFEELKTVLIEIENRATRIYNKQKELKDEIFNLDISSISSIRWPDFI